MKPLVCTPQQILNAGLNVFAFKLLAEDFSRLRVGNEGVEIVVQFQGKDGKPVYLHLSSSAERNAPGEYVQALEKVVELLTPHIERWQPGRDMGLLEEEVQPLAALLVEVKKLKGEGP